MSEKHEKIKEKIQIARFKAQGTSHKAAALALLGFTSQVAFAVVLFWAQL